MFPTNPVRHVLAAVLALVACAGCQTVSHTPERVWPAETPGAYAGATPATDSGSWWFPSEIGPMTVPATGGNTGTIFYTELPGPEPRPTPEQVVAVLPPPPPGVIRRVVYNRVFVEKDVRVERFIFPAVTFDPGNAAVDGESWKQLQQAAAAIRRARGYDVVIEGHADADEAAGVDLERAEVVKSVLVTMGVEEERLRVQGFGDSKPLARNGSAFGRSLNRRAAFQMIPANLDLDPQGPMDDPMPEVPANMRLETVHPTVTITRPRLVFVDRLIFPNILFDYDKADLRPEGAVRADRASAAARAIENVSRITVAGHCDFIGSHQYNDALSIRRARAVRDRLIERGLAPETVEAVGFGKRQPIADNDTREGRQLNRRVEFRIQYAE